MATCGYICPKCEGKSYDEEGISCTWCSPEEKHKTVNNEMLEEWIKAVHEGPCCSDFSAKSEG